MPPVQPASAEQDLILSRLMRIQESLYDKGLTYSQVILGLGYAGLLAVWVGTKEYLEPRFVVWSALLVTISVLAYVLFEVTQMIYLTSLGLALNKSMSRSKGNYSHALDEYARSEQRMKGVLLLVWAVVLAIALPTGLGAAGVLVWAFVRRLLTS